MTETAGLDPLSPSLNNASAPRKHSFMESLVAFFMCRSSATLRPSTAGGYVEFGDLRPQPGVKKVGAFAGVFCPVVLSMFSAVIFIRMGFIVGNAGLLVALAQFGLAYLIVVFTVMSICAISTNGAVEGGGVYFMISRTLGPEFGGAIGTLFFFANLASSALCISACTEGLVENFGPGGYLIKSDNHATLPDGDWYQLLYRTLLNVVGVGISLAGAALFARTSLAIWGVVVVCLASTFVSFFVTGTTSVAIPDTNHLVQNSTFPVHVNYTGLSTELLKSNLYLNYSRDYTTQHGDYSSFASIFGVLFTGVTGVMAGANMSGELKNPGRNIPMGTLAALLFTAVCYVALSILTAASCPRFLLQNNYVYLLPINIWPPFVSVGMLTATFSAGLSALIGASRVLEALVKDNIYGRLIRILGWSTSSGNPVAAVLFAGVLVQLAILSGSLNTIAQVNSVLFMCSYFAVNLACLGLDLASAPNFRPSFTHFSWLTSLAGLAGAAGAAFAVSAAYAAGAALACVSLVMALHVWSPAAEDARWGSLSQALIFHQVRKYLLLLDPRRAHVKFWRPQMLLLVSSPRQACPLIDFINDQKKGGLYVLGHVKIGQLDSSGDPLAPEQKHWLALIDHLKVKAFVELCLEQSVRAGAAQLSRLSGLGAMKPDTVILGFSDDATPTDFFTSSDSPYKTDLFESEYDNVMFRLRKPSESRLTAPEYVSILSDVLTVNKNLCLCRHFHTLNMAEVESSSSTKKYIDIWLTNMVDPHGDDPFTVASLFCLQLAAVVRSQRGWTRLALRIFQCQPATENSGVYINADGNVMQASPPAHLDDRLLPLASSHRPAKQRFAELLKMLRIQATIHEVGEFPTDIEPLRCSEVTDRSKVEGDASMFYNIPDNYIKRINTMIRSRSNIETAVVFLYLPPPPKKFTAVTLNGGTSSLTYSRSEMAAVPETQADLEGTKDRAYTRYLDVLRVMTEQLPPTMLVHGTKSVTSTAL